MKTKLFFLFSILFFWNVNAQVIQFADINLKNKLLKSSANNSIAQDINGVNVKIDENGDNEIQVNEAENIYYLDLYHYDGESDIVNISEVNFFKNLEILKIQYQHSLYELSLNGLLMLREIIASDNNLSNMSLSNLPKLQKLQIAFNNFNYIEIHDLPKLDFLDLTLNLNLSSFNYYNLPSLAYLSLFDTRIVSFNANNLPLLKSLDLSNTPLESLTINNLEKLETLGLMNCKNLSELNISNLIGLKKVVAFNNNLNFIDFSAMPNVEDVDVSDGKLNYIDIRKLSKLKVFFATSNLIETALIKNNVTNNISLYGNPIKYICTDESEITDFKNQFPEANVNSYCTFNPSGNYNTVIGNVSNCDNKKIYPNLKIKVDESDYSYNIFTNSTGNYKTYSNNNNVIITPILENSNYYTVTPSYATVNFADTNNNTFTQNFCVIPSGKHNDLEIQLAPIDQARPGFDATYRFVYFNKGNTTLSGSVNLDYQGNKIAFVSSELPPDTNINSNLVWNFTDLKPFEQKSFIVTFRLNSPTHPTDPLNAGDKLTFTAKIFPINNDETPKDNNLVLHQTVVNSLDPNDKTCLEGDVITPDLVGNDVHYLIRFENVGTANAVNVVVKDMIDTAKFDMESLQPIKSSHPYRMTITEGNKVEFFFENIQLPFDDANNDGYILFKIKTKPTLVVGDTFSNKADIYFDYNFPIATNEAITKVQNNLSTQEFSKSEISIYPNPVKDILTFKTKEKVKKAEIYDVNGRLIKVELGISNNQIDVSSLKTGTYVIKVISDKKYHQTKFIKQ